MKTRATTKLTLIKLFHSNRIRTFFARRSGFENDEYGSCESRVMGHKKDKSSYKDTLRERDLTNAEEIATVKQQHEKIILSMREGFESNLSDLRTRCEAKSSQLEDDLELRRKVDIHEIEERKNLHINDLMRNHEKAFGQMKSYYNDITNDNLQLIKDLKNETVEKKKKAVGIQKVMYDISQENKRLSEPLSAAVAEVADLRAQLKDQDKDRLSLRNAKARLLQMESQLGQTIVNQGELKVKYERSEKERDELYDSFERTVKDVQAKSDFKNLVLEQKLQGVSQNIEKAEAQLHEVVQAANIDPGDLAGITGSLDDMLNDRNAHIKDLQYAVMKMTKAYNDGLRTYSDKMSEIGIPSEEIKNLGFDFAPTTTSQVPAGLLVSNR